MTKTLFGVFQIYFRRQMISSLYPPLFGFYILDLKTPQKTKEKKVTIQIGKVKRENRDTKRKKSDYYISSQLLWNVKGLSEMNDT